MVWEVWSLVVVVSMGHIGCHGDHGHHGDYYNRPSRDHSSETVYYPGGPSRSYYRPKTFQTYDSRNSLVERPLYKESPRSYSKYDDQKYNRVKYEGPKYISKARDYEPRPRVYEPVKTYVPAYPSARKYEQPKVIYRSRPSQSYYQPVRRVSYVSPPKKTYSRRSYDDDYSRGGDNTRYYALTSPNKRAASYSQEKSYSRVNDPCVRKYDGQYVLSSEFRKLFPYVDNMCYFIKCANKKAFLNPCGPGTRNDKSGGGFCSHLDLEGYCGKTVYDAPKEEKKTEKYRDPGYKGSSQSYNRYY